MQGEQGKKKKRKNSTPVFTEVFFPSNSMKNRVISDFLFYSFKHDEKLHSEYQTIFPLLAIHFILERPGMWE